MDKPIHLLIVDDDAEIRELTSTLLKKYGFETSTAENGEAMLKRMEEQQFDLALLDIMMPGDDGLTICRKVRQTSAMPIIMVTAMGEDMDRIVGLEMGADDYIAKPFNSRELVARIKAVLRRTQPTQPTQPAATSNTIEKYLFNNWVLNLNTRKLNNNMGEDITLSAGEFDLLSTFLEKPQKILSRDYLLDATHNRTAGPFDRSIDVQVSRLRQKLEPDPKNPTLIITIRGGGYQFTPNVTTEYES